jgi:hypothetical protein
LRDEGDCEASVWSLATVKLDWPLTVAVKSKPTPESGIYTADAIAEFVTDRLPACGPVCVGAKTTPVVQLAPGARLAGQVLPAS